MVVVGVVAGPGTVACIQRGDFSQCMSETFFGGQPLVAETTQPVEDVATVTEPVESQPATSEETAISISAAVLPAFGLVRVEPDGSAVIAGTATPSGEVRIFANEELLGSEIAEPTGDWAFVTATPLPTGGVELRVLDVASEQFATTSVIVVVQDDRTSEPLVVASEPGAASEILQGIEQPAAVVAEEEVLDVAEAELPATEEAASTEEPAVVADEPEAPAQAEPVIEVAAAEAEPVAPAAVEEEILEVAEAPEIATHVAAEEPAALAAPVEDAVLQAEEATEAATPAEEPAVSEDSAAPAAPIEVAAVEAEEIAEPETPATVAEPAIVIVPPSIDAVEIDGDRNFFAGAGTDGYSVRLYVDNRPIGTTTVADGRWLIEAINVLTETAQRVRVDMLNTDGSVAGRAEVNFVLDIPAEIVPDEAPIVVAEEPSVAVEEPVAAPAAEPAQPVEDPAVAVEAPAAVAEEPAVVAAEPAAPVEAPAEQPVVADAPVVAAEPAAVEEPAAVAEEPVVAETPAEQPAAPVVVAEEEAPAAEETVPTLVGVVDGDRVVSGRVIIRRGDNLWTIARRVYGEGIRYTQIFEANTDQIRNPDLIYPGQVFDLPGTDAVLGDGVEK